MRRIALAVVTIALLAVPANVSAAESDALLAPEEACPGQSDQSLSLSAQASVMICMHRWARAQSGLPDLRPSHKLRATSKAKAHDILRCKNFSHTACGRDAFFWLIRLGFFHGRSGAGENLALGTGAAGSVRSMMTAWLNSPGHRAVMLAPKFTEIGVGQAVGKYHGYTNAHVWVAHFGYHR